MATPIRIPKVDPKKRYGLFINKTQAYEAKNGKIEVILKKQEFDGFTIPAGTKMTVDHVEGCSAGIIQVIGADLNKILKMLYFDGLKTIKHDAGKS